MYLFNLDGVGVCTEMRRPGDAYQLFRCYQRLSSIGEL